MIRKKKIDFECELSKLKGIKVGDKVKVYYNEDDGEKTVYKVKKKSCNCMLRIKGQKSLQNFLSLLYMSHLFPFY